MDEIERYRQIILETLTPLVEVRYANADVVNELVCDRQNDHYLVMKAGWEGTERRIHYCLVHLDIIGPEPRSADVEHVLSNSFGFGGQNAAVVLGRCS